MIARIASRARSETLRAPVAAHNWRSSAYSLSEMRTVSIRVLGFMTLMFITSRMRPQRGMGSHFLNKMDNACAIGWQGEETGSLKKSDENGP